MANTGIPAGCQAYNDLFASEALRMMGDVDMVGRYKSRFSALMRKTTLPDGAGYNWQSVLSDNTIPTNAVVWTGVAASDGTNGSCVADANPVLSATKIQNYSAFQTAFKSEDVCLTDARFGYLFEQQTENKKTNFERNIADAWEIQDRANYIASAQTKFVAAANLPFTTNSTSFPAIPAIYPVSQELLEVFGRKLDRDGAEEAGGAWAMKDGRAIYLVLMSSEAQEQIIKTSATTRQDFRFSDEGMGENAVLRKKFGLDRPYGGFFHMIDDRMPRYDFVNGAYVERDFFTTSADSIGTQAIVSSLYENAQYEAIIFWHPKVVERQMPANINTVGAGTKFGPINYNGDVEWLNIPNAQCNPKQTIGFWRADLMAAYRPVMTRYGYVGIVSRCVNQLYSFAPCS